MILIASIEVALKYLHEGYQIAKVTMDYQGLGEECLVAGSLMGLSKQVWWYVLLPQQGGNALGLVQKGLFIHLYEQYYIEPTSVVSETVRYYSVNFVCPVQEVPRHQRQIDSWEETVSSPAKDAKTYFG